MTRQPPARKASRPAPISMEIPVLGRGRAGPGSIPDYRPGRCPATASHREGQRPSASPQVAEELLSRPDIARVRPPLCHLRYTAENHVDTKNALL